MRVLAAEVLARIVLFNQKSKHIRERRGVYRDLVGKPEGKSSLERPRR
jgi:hypothetical protein